jgi:hypothetical protein
MVNAVFTKNKINFTEGVNRSLEIETSPSDTCIDPIVKHPP